MKENNQCYLAAAEVFSRLREGVSIDSPRALARSLPPPRPPPPPPPRPPPPRPHSSASFTGWSRGVPHNGIINTQAPGAAPLSRCSGPPAAANAGSCSPSTHARLSPERNPPPRWTVGATSGRGARPASVLDHLLGSGARFKPVPVKRTGNFKLFLVFSSFSLQKPYVCFVVLF